MQLFCFPCAGGTANFFNQLDPWFSPAVERVKLEYAGHGARHREPLYQDFSQLAEDLYALVKGRYRPGAPYALLGYSMGSVAAVEVLVRILRRGDLPEPCRVFLMAHGPSARRELIQPPGGGSDDWIKKRTIALGGVPEKLQENPVYWRVHLPLYRADYGLISNYPFEELALDCRVPLTGLYGTEDLPGADMEAWRRYFRGECFFRAFPGGHFFMTMYQRDVAELVEAQLTGGGCTGGI